MLLSAADAPLMDVYDKNVSVYYFFISKGKKNDGKPADLNVEVYLATLKSKYLARRVNSSGGSIVLEWAELLCG